MNGPETQFMIALHEFLSSHGVELEASDHYPGYPECGEDIRIEATGPNINIDFGGRYVDATTVNRLLKAGD